MIPCGRPPVLDGVTETGSACEPVRRTRSPAPLTADRAEPAVPFGGDDRLVDFVLSNLVNGGYLKIVG